MPAAKLILVCFQYRDSCRRRMREGILRFARVSGWNVRIAYVYDPTSLRLAVRRYHPDGLVVNVYFHVPKAVLRSVPTVRLACNEKGVLSEEGIEVRYGSESTARLAVRELASLGCADFAFASIDWGFDWSLARSLAFAAEIARRGGRSVEPFLSRSIRLTSADRAALDRWVRRLPKRCGVFASNDAMARGVVDACLQAGVSVPGDVAVVGVDDDLRSCQCRRPTLTTVVPDWGGGGFIAMAALSELIRGVSHSDAVRYFQPLGICRRETTGRRFSPENSRVIQVTELIREKACTGLDVQAVVREMRCSRRYAEKVFRETTGMSILEAIRLVRFDAAKTMLLEGAARISDIAGRSGYASVQTFIREFKKLTGSAPQSWRRRNVPGP